MRDEGLSPMSDSSVHAMGALGCFVGHVFPMFHPHCKRRFVDGKSVVELGVFQRCMFAVN